MSEEKPVVTRTGIGFTGLLALIFVTLKLLGVINWSWVYVTMPVWLGWAVLFVIAVVMGVVGGILLLVLFIRDKIREMKRKKSK